jgi:type IV fimbrial biogenesis protein FimT
MNRPQQYGFTLWELLMTLLVGGILLGIGVPNVMEFQRSALMTAAANDIVTAVLMARTEAVKRQAPVTLCLTADPMTANPVCLPNPVADFANGWFVWVDENGNTGPDGQRLLNDATDGNAQLDGGETVLLRGAAPGGTIRISADCGYATFAPSGFTQQAAALCFPAVRSLLLCDDRGNQLAAGSLAAARAVRIDRPGRGQVLQEQADITNTIATLTASGVAPTCP